MFLTFGGYILLKQKITSPTTPFSTVTITPPTSASTSAQIKQSNPGEITEIEVIESIKRCEVTQITGTGPLNDKPYFVDLKDKRHLKLVGPEFYGTSGFNGVMNESKEKCGSFVIFQPIVMIVGSSAAGGGGAGGDQ